MYGWESVHPWQESRLRFLGINGDMITQGWGYAAASAGSHVPVGIFSGRRFGYCIDISARWQPNRIHFDDFITVGFCPFWRDWEDNQHWHLVDVARLKDDTGRVPAHPAIARRQVEDFIHKPALNGLKDHAPLPPAWAPTDNQQGHLIAIWQGLKPAANMSISDIKIIYPADKAQVIDCNPAIDERGKLRADVRPLCEALGFTVVWNEEQRKAYIIGAEE